MRATRLLVGSAVLLGVASPAGPAYAHQQGVSTSTVSVGGGQARYDLTLSSHDLQEIDADHAGVISEDEVVAQYPALRHRFERAMVVQAGRTPCPLTLQDFFIDPVGTVLFRFRGPCPDEPPLKVAFQLLAMSGAPGYDEATITFRGTVTQRIFTRDETTVIIGAQDESAIVIGRRLFGLGLRSTVDRIDVLVLLVALVFVAGGWRSSLATVASFGLGQAGGLVLATLDVLVLPSRLAESFVALAIAWTALDNVLFDRRSDRWVLAGACGLLAGLGLAMTLRTASASSHPVPSLIGFAAATVTLAAIVGAIVVAVSGAVQGLHRRRTVVVVLSSAILIFGLYRFVERAFLA